MPWLWQQPDGRWPAVAVAFTPDASGANRLAVVDRAGQPERDLRATALVVLAVVADGQTQLGHATRRSRSLRAAVDWLRSCLDATGRFCPTQAVDGLFDQALATYALSEVGRTSGEGQLAHEVARAATALADGLANTAPASIEVGLWGVLVARSVTAFAATLASGEGEGESAARRAAAGSRQLALPGEALLPQARRWVLTSPDRRDPTSPSARAARRLLRALGELAPEAEPANAPSTAPTDPTSSATSSDATEPLAALYDVLSAYRSGASAWRRISPQVAREIAQAQLRRGPWAGTWEPVGAFAADSGRCALAAVHTITLTVYYRYCRLEVATALAGGHR